MTKNDNAEDSPSEILIRSRIRSIKLAYKSFVKLAQSRGSSTIETCSARNRLAHDLSKGNVK